MAELSTDWWISQEDPIGDPKRQNGDYVESEGYLVAPRYDTLEAALYQVRAGETIIIRSEHLDEYDGPSGLLSSFILNERKIREGEAVSKTHDNPDIDEALHGLYKLDQQSLRSGQPLWGELKQMVIGDIMNVDAKTTFNRFRLLTWSDANVQHYAEMINGEDCEVFIRNTKYSLWKYVPGINVAAVADDVIPDRYHLLTSKEFDEAWHPAGYVIDGSGNLVRSEDSLKPDSHDWVFNPEFNQNIIGLYEGVRNLPRYVHEHCPIIEMQVDEAGNTWFLQYHRSRDTSKPVDRLLPKDFPANDGWLKADGVRGAVPQPVTLLMARGYPARYGLVGSRYNLPEVEPAASDNKNHALNEIMSRRRTAYLLGSNFTSLYHEMASHQHQPRSNWFKPQVSIATAQAFLFEFIPEAIRNEVNAAIAKGDMARIAIDVAADGVSGYFRINPDSEQPVYTDF